MELGVIIVKHVDNFRFSFSPFACVRLTARQHVGARYFLYHIVNMGLYIIIIIIKL